MMQAAAAAGSSSHPEVSTAAPAEHHHAVSGEFCLPTLQRLLQQLEGRELDCFAFARDTVEGELADVGTRAPQLHTSAKAIGYLLLLHVVGWQLHSCHVPSAS
jgi:hypothetical protein